MCVRFVSSVAMIGNVPHVGRKVSMLYRGLNVQSYVCYTLVRHEEKQQTKLQNCDLKIIFPKVGPTRQAKNQRSHI